MEYIIALGSNLHLPNSNLTKAKQLISEKLGEVALESSRYWTKPLIHPEYPNPNQNRYLNSVVSLNCDLTPSEVLEILQGIERQLGRVRENELHPWSPRTIDLDIIAAGTQLVDEPELTIPHPRAVDRDFVLIPIREIAPEWIHPALSKNVQQLVAELSEVNILEKYEES